LAIEHSRFPRYRLGMASSNHGPVVLVVEDDDDICDLLAELMTMHGYGAVGVRTIQDGLALLRRGLRPRVVVLDPLTRDHASRHLPELTADPAWQPAPVILGVGAGGARAPGEGLLRRHLLPKPLDLGELFEALARYLGRPIAPPEVVTLAAPRARPRGRGWAGETRPFGASRAMPRTLRAQPCALAAEGSSLGVPSIAIQRFSRGA
jgi:DNA-binding NtrC family response regulator